jgi:hypothetical protein
VATSVARRTIGRLRRLPCAIPVAAMLTTMAGAAFAQNCTGVCADEVALMSSFISLPNSAAGLALLNANLHAEESIYLNSTQAKKVTAAANVLLQYMPANVLIGAFPTDPRFQYDAQGFPPTLALPSSINNIVASLLNVPAMDDLKTVFGQINNYGKT